VLLTAPFVLARTRWQLQRHGYRATLASAQRTEPDAQPSEEQLVLARETAYALAVAVKFGPWRPLCLLRSMTLGSFLGRRGIPFEVRIGLPDGGITPVNGNRTRWPDFTAHAWVECGGEVLNDRADVALVHRVFGTRSRIE